MTTQVTGGNANAILEALSDVEDRPQSADQFPPGAVGRVAQYCLDTSRYPNPGLGLGAGLATVGKLADRRVAGPTNLPTVLYLVLLAETGVGKQRALEVPKQILMETGKGNLVARGDWASVQAG